MSINSEIGPTPDPDTYAAEIVAAYVSNNQIPPAELPGLIEMVRAALNSLGKPPEKVAEPEPPTPAVSIKKSVTPDHIVCLDCGKSFKSLKRHILTHHQLTPDDYRQRWNLNASYPMVAPNYADARSQLALSMGLGRKRAAEAATDDAAAGSPDASNEADVEAARGADAANEAATPVEAEESGKAPEPKRRGGGRRKAASA